MADQSVSDAVPSQIDVFISYSSRNYAAAQSIHDELTQKGWKCFLAYRTRDDIAAGENWVERLMEALKNTRVVLLVLSHDSNASEQVQNEIGIAVKYHVNILPVRIQNEEPGEILEYYLVHKHRLDLIPAPPPIPAAEKQRLLDLTERLLRGEKLPAAHPQKQPVSLLSIWYLHPLGNWVKKVFGGMSALNAALITYLVMFAVFFLPLAISHRAVGTVPPASLGQLFSAAEGIDFYYPDLNAVLFDVLLHPAAFATWVFFLLFVQTDENQYLLNAAGGFISVRRPLQAQRLIRAVNLLAVKLLPLLVAAWMFFYRREVYLGYGMQEPLVFWAALAVGLSIYVIAALSINASYIALLVKPIHGSTNGESDSGMFLTTQSAALAKLSLVFVYVICMCAVEIAVMWMMADFNGATVVDLIRWVTAGFGTLAIGVLTVRLAQIWGPELSQRKESALSAFRQLQAGNWLLLLLPVVLIGLTIRLAFQVYGAP